MNRYFKVKAMFPILLGIVVGLVLFIFGEAEDAPGLCLIGIIAAFLLIMRGIYHAKVIQKAYHIPIILLVFGVIGIILPIILYLDEEIALNNVFIGITIGIALIAAALLRFVKVRNKSFENKHNWK